MTRISSIFFASALAVLPISAFAQQPAGAAKGAETTGMSTASPNAGSATSTETTAKPEVKSSQTKSEVQGSKSMNHHHSKASAPAKTTEPNKS